MPTAVPRTVALIAVAAFKQLSAQTVTLPAADNPLTVTETEVFRVGGGNAPDWALFHDLRAVAFDTAGRVYLLETRGARITRLKSDGSLDINIGRRGQGPGEYTAPGQFAVFPDGRIFVRDILKDALLEYDPAGNPGTERKIEFPDGEGHRIEPAGVAGLAYSSEVLIVGSRRVVSGRYDEPATTLPLGFIVPGQPRARTIARAWLPPYTTPAMRFARALLEPTVSWTVLAGATIAYADTLTYRITLVDAAGGRRTMVRPLPVRRTTPAERSWAIEDYRSRMIDPSGRPRIAGAGGAGGAPPAIQAAEVERGVAASTVADELQTIRKLGTDGNNRLWIHRLGASVDKPGPIDIVDASGRYAGTLPPMRFPDAFGPNGLVAYIDRDSNDATVIVVKRLVISGVRE